MEVLLEKIAWGFQLLGVFALVIGCIYTLVHFFLRLFHRHTAGLLVDIRLELGKSIAIALEFFVAADIIHTVVTPDYYQIGILSILVVVRTILTYFLQRELAELEAPRK